MKVWGVLTGDLVGSSQMSLERLDEAKELLRRLVVEFEATYPGAVIGGVDFFRGDGWQLVLRRPALAVRAAVFLRAGFRAEGLDTRVGIGWGGVARLNLSRVSESIGEAFLRSGQALDRLSKGRMVGVGGWGLSEEMRRVLAVVDAGLGLLDELIGRWTQRESLAVYGVLRRLAQRAVAELPQAKSRRGVAPRRQAIQQALRRAAWANSIQPFLLEVEGVIEGMIPTEVDG